MYIYGPKITVDRIECILYQRIHIPDIVSEWENTRRSIMLSAKRNIRRIRVFKLVMINIYRR